MLGLYKVIITASVQGLDESICPVGSAFYYPTRVC